MRALALCSFVLFGTGSHASTLGPASDYNLFVFSDYIGHNSDVQGRVAIGGNAELTNMGINSLAKSGADGLLVQGNLTAQNGQLYSGDARVGGSTSLISFNILPPGVLVSGGIPSGFFADAQSQLQSRADYYFSLPSNGSTAYSYGSIVLDGSDFTSNIFEIDGTMLSATNGLQISAPVGSSVLVNVTGETNSMQNFGFMLSSGIGPDNILFNFANTTSLSLSSIGVQGSVLAPRATVDFNNGQLNGALVAYLARGNGEYHWSQPSGFPSGDPSPVPEPGAFTLVLIGLGAAYYLRGKRLKSRRITRS